jgi:hypothetical protein
MTDRLSKLWLEYADAHPAEWLNYRGDCQCPTCEEYRKAFEAWAREEYLERMLGRDIPASPDESD